MVEPTVAATGYAVDAQEEPTSPPTATNAGPYKAPKILSELLNLKTGPTREQTRAAEGVLAEGEVTSPSSSPQRNTRRETTSRER